MTVTAEGRELLSALLDRAEPKRHTARPRYRPLGWRRRRDAHRCYWRFAGRVHDRERCTS